jgi:hypothetical protein
MNCDPGDHDLVLEGNIVENYIDESVTKLEGMKL